jgi:glycosyltransferase involved in cell wall biosynthesis
MNAPAISVVLPAFNCEAYLGKAIRSVLEQTFTDFELIIINDGSTDNTEFVILSFPDPRIVYLKNPANRGLIYTLNRAIEVAQGNYIARMDADDICLPERLAKQKEFLDKHPEMAVVATTIDYINEKEEKTGSWERDRKIISPEQIRRKMPFENCIAHPTIMIRSGIMKTYKYKSYQENIEDYDLWLRLLNRGLAIAKINEPLVLYRLHSDSVTSVHLKKKNFYFKQLNMKWKLLWHETLSGNLAGYLFLIKFAAFTDLVKGVGKYFKNLFTR